MYLDFYKFRERPFNLTPDPRFIYLSKQHKEAFAHLLFGIQSRAGFILLTGEVGSGKTTVLRTLLTQLDADHYRTALIFNPCLSPLDLLRYINREFGLSEDLPTASSLLDGLNQFLLKENGEGRTVVLVIDEAQDLEMAVLEQIRLISNLETDRDKLIQIILSGQPELVRILDRDEMRQLDQRITVRYHLRPMDFQDTVQYIHHRLELAGVRGEGIFTHRALKEIYRYSCGLPRLINAACDRALLTGYARDRTKIDARVAKAGIREMDGHTGRTSVKLRRFAILPLAMSILLMGGVFFFKGDGGIGSFLPSRSTRTADREVEPILRTGERGLLRAMVNELRSMGELDSALKAFNVLSACWKVSPIPEITPITKFGEIEEAALERGLRVYRFSGNLGTLIRLNLPACLELKFPEIPGGRFIPLVGLKRDQVLVAPIDSEKGSLSFFEVERLWTGRAFILWRDFLGLLTDRPPGMTQKRIERLQEHLREAGC